MEQAVDDELMHECGIAAIYHLGTGVSNVWQPQPNRDPNKVPNSVTDLMPQMLLDLQNRGQLSAGMATYDPSRPQMLDTFKELGPVSEAFRTNQRDKFEKILLDFKGQAAIGHVRYATCGTTGRRYAQPFERRHGCKWKWFAFGFNGNLANYEQLREEILSLKEYHLTRDNDTEVIMHHLAHAMRGDQKPNLVEVMAQLAEKFDGAYNLVLLNGMGDMVVARDPLGIRPLCYAFDGTVFAAASESVALLNLGFKEIHSLEPGQMVLIEEGEVSFHRFAPAQPTSAHCFFEWIYFANVASTLDERSVYLSRSRLGQELAKQEREQNLIDFRDGNTIVVPVPDTGKAAADSMAYELGIPSLEGLIRNRYIGRTFIEHADRAKRVRLKFTPLREVLQGKRVILVEDSIVRGTTLINLLDLIREQGGAAEVHVRVASPPIIAPCFYGIDMASISQLFASNYLNGSRVVDYDEQQKMAQALGADSLLYLPLDAVARSIDLPENRLCRACLTGDYPTDVGQERYELQLVNARQSKNGPAVPARAAALNT